MASLPLRTRWLVVAVLLTVTSLACALMQEPTPFVLPTPSAVAPASPSATASPTISPPTATSTTTPTATPSPPDTLTPTASPEPPTLTPTHTWTPAPPTPSPTTAPDLVRVSFSPGATDVTLVADLDAGASRTYVLRIAAGQLIDASVTTQQTLQMAIQGADDTVIKPAGHPFHRGAVPTSQDYLVTLTAPDTAATYTLTIMIPVRITFAPGSTTAQLQATIPPNTSVHFVIRALAGQTMTLDTTAAQGQVIAIVYGADGTVLQSDHAGAPDFSGNLPITQDYLIHLRSVGAAAAIVTLDVTIPPLQ